MEVETAMNQKLLFIMNPYSGTKTGKRHLADILELFCQADYVPTVFMTTGPGNGRELARRYGPEADLCVACGGDGTFNEVVSGIVESGAKTPIGYIPCGSTNDFANSIGLNKNLLQAAADIIGGKPHFYDVGRFGQRHFTYVASFGAFTRVSYNTPQNVKNALGHLAYLLEGFKELSSIRPRHVRFECDRETFEGNYIFGAISNSTSLGGILTLDPDTVDMNDGLFELLLIRCPKNLAELNDCIRALRDQTYDSPLLTFHSTSQLTVTAEPDMAWTLDGEREEGHEKIWVENLRDAIRLISNR